MNIMDRRIKPARVPEAVAHALEQYILCGEYKAGERLPAERHIAETLGVSRTSVREAIQKLNAKGILTTRRGDGTFVTGRLENGFSEPWEEMVDYHPWLRGDLLEVRHMLEPKAAELAAERASGQDIDNIAAAIDRLETAFASDDFVRLVQTDHAFHQALITAAHNSVFNHLTSSLLRLMRHGFEFNLTIALRTHDARKELQQQHREVFASVCARDPRGARKAAEKHVDYVRQLLSEAERRKVTYPRM